MKRICIPENTICFQDNTKKVTKQGQIAECLDVQISHLGKCKLRKHICMFFCKLYLRKHICMFLQIVIGKTCICFLQVIVEKKYLYRRKEKLRPVLELQVKLFNFRPFPEQWKYCCAIPFVRSRDDQNTYLLSNLINLELEVHLCERYLISIKDTRSSSST